jgi:hypothetical protein
MKSSDELLYSILGAVERHPTKWSDVTLRIALSGKAKRGSKPVEQWLDSIERRYRRCQTATPTQRRRRGSGPDGADY